VSDATAVGERDPGQAARGLALIRVAAVPVIFIGERLVEHPTLKTDPFDYILVGAAIYALVALTIAYSRYRSSIPGVAYATLDLGLICALTYYSGGAFSQLRYAFFLLPIGAAFLLTPALTAGASVVSVLAYVVISLTHPATEARSDLEFVLTQAVYLSWMAVAAILLARALTRRAERIIQLATDRGRLVAQALNTEDRERRRLAESLHDHAIQNLLVVRQELDDGRLDGTGLARARAGVDRTIEQLRRAVFDLHPYVLEQAGLGAALQGVADQQGLLGGYRPHVTVGADATGIHDQLIFSVARELLINVAKHAKAETVSLTVDRVGDEILLEVADDGTGIDPGERAAALLEGHIGLASSAQRIEAVGGRFELLPAPGRGTTVRATLPATPPVQTGR
jgi:two-component system NarL family sensor kinase